jgi:hypothetical protein
VYDTHEQGLAGQLYNCPAIFWSPNAPVVLLQRGGNMVGEQDPGYQGRPWDGMYPRHSCRACGRLLNHDGNHPAELYAGTYTGMCYACKRTGPFVVATFEDGCQLVSHPPHCPAWRRDREEYYWYEGCGQCQQGRLWVSRAGAKGGPYTRPCPTCAPRHDAEVSEQRRRKLQGNTPFEQLAANYAAEQLRLEAESRKRVTKTRTRERKDESACLARDYADFARRLPDAVWLDAEEQFISSLADWLPQVRSRVASGEGGLGFPAAQLAMLERIAKELLESLPAHLEAKQQEGTVP